jgi:hypothetical protein
MPENNTNHPVLPQLEKNRTIKGFANVGVWDPRKPIELANLSNDLKVEDVGIELNSIPDVWARPLLFDMSLFNPGHLLRRRSIAEWRGLMAMIALKEALDLTSFRAVPISIPTDPEALARSPAFLRAAANLVPTSTIDPETSWHNLYVFLWGNNPIGMTSPTTLVVTATNYFGSINQDLVPWFNGQVLVDPTKRVIDDRGGKVRNPVHQGEFLGKQQRGLLAGWLRHLSSALQTRVPEGINSLLSLINSYVGDLGVTAEDAPSISMSRQSSLGMTSGVFALLDRPVAAVRSPASTSHVRLVQSRGESAPRIPILVVDKDIARQWQRDETEITVGDGKTLRTAIPTTGFPEDPPSPKNRLGNAIISDAEVWAPIWFFKKKLYVIGKARAFDKVVGINLQGELKFNEQAVTPILPLDQVLIDHLSVDDLAQRVSFEQHNEGILVTLRLRLNGSDDDFVTSRLYRRNSGEIQLLEGIPVLEVWPDFKAPTWKAYYTYYDRSLTTETFEAKPYYPGLVVQNGDVGQISDKRRITKTEQYPEAVICSLGVGTGEIGFCLIEPRPEKNHEVEVKYDVGVDFGATGTNIYFKVGGQNPQPFELKDRYVSVTSPKDRNVIYDNCLPAQTEKTPFLSIFKRFPNAPAENLRPLLDSIIFFPGSTLPNDDSKITYNLKWSDESSAAHKAEAFLKQIALQVAAEAASKGAGRINWHYSYPTAFGKSRYERFSAAWQAVVAACAEMTGVESSAEPIAQSESIAAAQYFCDSNGHSAPTNMGAVFVDIGGSTSDIAIWQGGLLWQSSVLLGGRDIFLDFLHDNLDFLKSLKSDLDLTPLKAAKDIDRTTFYAQVDHLLRREGEKLMGNLRTASTESEKMKQVVAVGMSGLFFYIGLILRHLKATEKFQDEIPSFFFGGNGSQIFRWLSSGLAFTSSSASSLLFKRVFFKASGLSVQPLKIELSKKPKAEAAFGLICGTNLNGAGKASAKQVLAGESFSEGSQEKPWNSLLDSDDETITVSVPKKLEKLEEFILAYNEGAREAELPLVAPKDSDRAELLREVRRTLSNNISTREPIFILALKSLLKTLRA